MRLCAIRAQVQIQFFLFIKILQNTSYITYMHLHCIPTEYILKETLELIPCAKVPAVRLKGSLRINLNLKFEHRIFNYFTIIYIYIYIYILGNSTVETRNFNLRFFRSKY
jgi:hypothetical protein